MHANSLQNYLDIVAKQVVKDAQRILRSDKGDTALGASIRSEVQATAKGYSISFYMQDYGAYLDEGVSGNSNPVSFTNYKGMTEASRFQYTTKGPPIDILSKWIKKKGIKPEGFGRGRSKDTGQYLSGFAYLISKKIKREGIPSISFFQLPLGVAYNDLQQNLVKKFKIDVTNYLVSYTKNRK